MKGGERHINDELLIKYLLGEADESEQLQVQQWLAASEDNAQYFAGFQLIWKESGELAGNSEVSVDDAWERFNERISDGRSVERQDSYRWIKIAAALLLLAGSAWLIYSLPGNGTPAAVSFLAKAEQPVPPANQVRERAPDSTKGSYSMPVAKSELAQKAAKKASKGEETVDKPTVSTTAEAKDMEKGTDMMSDAARNEKPAGGSNVVTGTASLAANTSTVGISETSIMPGKVADSNTFAYEWHRTSKPGRAESAVAANRKPMMAYKAKLADKADVSSGYFKYDRTNNFICNSTPCPIEICIIQKVKCGNGKPSAISSCSVLEPDESGQLRYRAPDRVAKNCEASIDEIRIKRVTTGETIVLTSDSKPATAQEFFSYITGEKTGDIIAGMFHTDCNNNRDDCGLMFDNSNLILH